jgi:hypothetical protein
MTSLRALQELCIAANKFKILPGVVYQLVTLCTIVASDNQIETIEVEGLAQLPVLQPRKSTPASQRFRFCM